jgi:uncharacterized SAM-binding protein YcdF (DUF218 family)
MIWSLGSMFKGLFLPPLGLAWLAVLAWLLWRRRPRAARCLLGAALALGYLSATPLASRWLMQTFITNVDTTPAPGKPQAIVVLGGGRKLAFDQQGRVQQGYVSGFTLERVLTGAQLHRLTGLPVLVTGGKPDGYDPPEGDTMRTALERDFGVPVRWTESASRNTVENAQFSAPMLREAGVKTIFLVTSDFHMRRSRALFESQGFAVTPVFAMHPLLPDGRMLPVADEPFRWRQLVANMSAAQETYFACNEMAGMLYARLNMR